METHTQPRKSSCSEEARLKCQWWEGPEWLAIKENWPTDIVTSPSLESLVETKLFKEIFYIAIPQPDVLDQVLQKWSYWKTLNLRVGLAFHS